ncbi:MAG: ATP-binding cassette domain-containing protein [Leucobacter sp.]
MANKTPLIDPAVLLVLRPSVPGLMAAVLGAVLSGVSALVAIWGIVRMIGEPSANIAVWICVAWLTAALLSAASSWLAHSVEGQFEARLRRDVARHLLRLPADRLGSYPVDKLRRLISEDIASLHHMIAHLPSEVAVMIVIPICSVLLLLVLAGPASLAALVPGLLAAVVYLTVIPRRSARHGAERSRVMGEITTAVDDYARGIHIFRSYGIAKGAMADFTDATSRFTSGMVAWVRRVATPAAVAVALLQAVASYAIAYAVGSGRDTATLAATLLLSLALVTPALRLGHGLDYVASGRAASSRIGGLLSEPSLQRGSVNTVTKPPSIQVDHLAASANERGIIDDLTLHLPSSTITAIIGPSGAGKSTFLRIVAGLQRPSVGSVRIGGTDISSLDEDVRTETVLLIPQGLAVLPTTVRENLLLIRPNADDSTCVEALHRAQIDVSLDTDASTLSGGERQRVSLARAFLSPAQVILLDEPTSALDDGMAARVWKELDLLAYAEGKTIVIVTHDPHLAERADGRHVFVPATNLQEGGTW